jgi:hypothetical protein
MRGSALGDKEKRGPEDQSPCDGEASDDEST